LFNSKKLRDEINIKAHFNRLDSNFHFRILPPVHPFFLQQLLSHRARLIPFKGDSEVYPIVDYEAKIDINIPLPEKRYHFIRQVLTYDPIPLYDHHDDRYSNAGYIAAALMLEKASNRTWKELIMEISDDLDLRIHIGWPDQYGSNQPKGHINPKYWDIDMDEIAQLLIKKFGGSIQ